MSDFGRINSNRRLPPESTADAATPVRAENGQQQHQVEQGPSPQSQSTHQVSETERRRRQQEFSVEGESIRAYLQMQYQQASGGNRNVSPAQYIRQNLGAELENAGLSRTEQRRITQHLSHLSGPNQEQEVNFLRDHVLNSPNADRALRTYSDLNQLRSASGENQARISPQIIHTLTRGVAEPRSSRGGNAVPEGILGRDQALRAARTIIAMQPSDYNQISELLSRTGKPVGPQGIPQRDDPELERALILKAVAARSNELQVADSRQGAMQEITGFANDIRGVSRDGLIPRMTTVSINQGRLESFAQVDGRTCVPASAEMIRAEMDPIYASWLTNPSNASEVARQQRELIVRHDPDRSGGINNPIEYGRLLDSVAGTQNQRSYTPAYIARETDEGVRHAEVQNSQGTIVGTLPVIPSERASNRVAELVGDGLDIPIVVRPPGQNEQHAMVITDVREGSGQRHRFLVQDPANGGNAFWVDERALLARSADHPGWNPNFGSWVYYFEPSQSNQNDRH